MNTNNWGANNQYTKRLHANIQIRIQFRVHLLIHLNEFTSYCLYTFTSQYLHATKGNIGQYSYSKYLTKTYVTKKKLVQ